MALFGTSCPVGERERNWVHCSMAWLRAQLLATVAHELGHARLRGEGRVTGGRLGPR